MKLEFCQVTLLTNYGLLDRISFKLTDSFTPVFPNDCPNDGTWVNLNVDKATGDNWLKKNFRHLGYERIDGSSGERKYINTD